MRVFGNQRRLIKRTWPSGKILPLTPGSPWNLARIRAMGVARGSVTISGKLTKRTMPVSSPSANMPMTTRPALGRLKLVKIFRGASSISCSNPWASRN